MSGLQSLFIVSLSAQLINIVLTKSCDTVTENACGCIMNDGNSFSLDQTVQQKLTAQTEQYEVSYAPCNGIICTIGGSLVPVCADTGKYGKIVMAKYEGSMIEIDNKNNPSIIYGSAVEGIAVKVKLICDAQIDKPEFKFIEEESLESFLHFQLTSKATCDFVSQREGGGLILSGGISVGSILLIIFFVSLIVYLIIGVAYETKVKNSLGLDRIPNKSFWAYFIENIQIGVSFLKAKILQRRNDINHQPLL